MKRNKILSSIVLLFALFCIFSLTKMISIKATEKDSNKEEFTIKNNVLTKYNGEGTNIIIPDGVTAIRNYAFNHCDTIVTVTIPDTVTSIGDSSFASCDNLRKVVMTNSVTSIGNSAFWASVNLEEISTMENVKSIGHDAFGLTLWLKERAEIDPIVVVNGFLIDGRSCKGDVVLPESITSIQGDAFLFNKEITSITIPNTVKSIGIESFYNCQGLITVKMAEEIDNLWYKRLLYRNVCKEIPDTISNSSTVRFKENVRSIEIISSKDEQSGRMHMEIKQYFGSICLFVRNSDSKEKRYSYNYSKTVWKRLQM